MEPEWLHRPNWTPAPHPKWLLPPDRFGRTLASMTIRRSSPVLTGPDGHALLASSVVARLPLAMISIATLVHVQRITGSFAIAGLACSAYAICGALASPMLGRLVDHHGQTTVLLAGAAMTAATLIAMG